MYSGQQCVESFADGPDSHNFAVRVTQAGFDVGLGNDAAGESHLCRFLYPERRLADPADFARQTDLAKHGRGGRNGPVPDARRNRSDDPQVGRGFVNGNPTGHIDEYIIPREVQARAFFEDREKQRKALLVDSARHPSSRSICAGTNQSLYFDEDGPRPLHRAKHGGPRGVRGPLGEEHLRGVRHGAQAGGRHLEYPQLADGAEATLDGAHDGVGVMALSLEVQHGIDDVLEGFGAGERPVLRDVADENRRNVLTLCREEKLRRRLADLPDAAWRRLELEREDRLHRIDDDQRRPYSRDLFEDPLETCFGEQI